MHRSREAAAPGPQPNAERPRPGAAATRGLGSHALLLAQACARHPHNPQAQFAWYLAHAVVPAATGRRRQVSDKTRSDFGDTLKALPALLRRLRCPLQNANELGRAHVLALLRHWQQQGHSEGTIQWRLSLLRRFFTLVGKPQALPAGAPWQALLKARGIVVGSGRRLQVASTPRGWSERGVDPLPLIEVIRCAHPVEASQLELSLFFGLRKNEALQLRPAEADQGSHLNVVDGTKGGKPRSVAFSSDPARAGRQRQALDRAKALAAHHPQGRLAEAGRSLAQARDHLNYVLRKHSITKKALGVTQHGLRHQFGCELFETLSGLPAPVQARVPAALYGVDPAQQLAARRLVSRQMGHQRIGITGAYTGSVPVLAQACRQRLGEWQAAAPHLATILRPLQAQRAWITGRCAWGLPPAAGEALEICLQVADTSFHAALLQQLRTAGAAAGRVLGLPVVLSVRTDACAPADGIALAGFPAA